MKFRYKVAFWILQTSFALGAAFAFIHAVAGRDLGAFERGVNWIGCYIVTFVIQGLFCEIFDRFDQISRNTAIAQKKQVE